MREDGAMYSPLTPGLKRRRFDGMHHVQSGQRRESLPPIYVRRESPKSAVMPPPGTPRDVRRHSGMDANLDQNGQPKSVEDTVLSIPYQSKIKLLGRITPPYKACTRVRGAIIAVEGDNVSAVKELTKWLNDFLTKHENCHSQIAQPPKSPSKETVEFNDYLGLIQEWHSKSKEMIKYITTPIPCPPSEGECEEDTLSDKELPVITTTTTTRKDSATPSPPTYALAKPIILLPTFQLHASVAYASRIPVQDAYSAMDHWQWMATLWRGTVGPDLTIYTRTCCEGGKEGMGSSKLVELDEVARCLTVVREREGGVAEGVLRRVGFEVGEFIRGVGGGAE